MGSRRKQKVVAAPPVRKPTIVRFALVIVVGVLALFASFIAVPAFARQAGLHDQHVNYALAVAALLIGIITTRSIKSLRKKSAEKK